MDLNNEDKYKEKYLKYKIKYIRLKQIETNEDEYKEKYLKYKRKYIELKQLGAKDPKDFYCLNGYCIYKSINYLLTTSGNAKKYKTAVEYKKDINLKKNFMTVNKKFNVIPIGKDVFVHNTIDTEFVEYEDEDGNMTEAKDIDTIREVLATKAIEIENKVHDAFLKWYNKNKKKKMNTMLVHGTTEGAIDRFKIFKLSKKPKLKKDED